MPSLRELQEAFASALLGESDANAAFWLADKAVSGSQGLSVYRNNSRAAFLDAMMACYPVLLRLTGEAYFRQMAFAYRRRFPSRAGNLFHVGCRLPEFLEAEYAGGEYAYFADVAHLEWACQEALVAAERDGLDTCRLATVESYLYPRLRFVLHPSVRLLRSAYPLFEIWRDNQPGAEPGGMLDLAKGGESLLVRRSGEVAEVRQLSRADFDFLSALKAGTRFADALDQALDPALARATGGDSGFDAITSLETWVSLKVIVDFSLESVER